MKALTQQETKMNTAFFVTGSAKELKAAEVLVKKQVPVDTDLQEIIKEIRRSMKITIILNPKIQRTRPYALNK